MACDNFHQQKKLVHCFLGKTNVQATVVQVKAPSLKCCGVGNCCCLKHNNSCCCCFSVLKNLAKFRLILFCFSTSSDEDDDDGEDFSEAKLLPFWSCLGISESTDTTESQHNTKYCEIENRSAAKLKAFKFGLVLRTDSGAIFSKKLI